MDKHEKTLKTATELEKFLKGRIMYGLLINRIDIEVSTIFVNKSIFEGIRKICDANEMEFTFTGRNEKIIIHIY